MRKHQRNMSGDFLPKFL
ncbi:hypothetical protein Pint_18615 [Pistacia integerrima]|uniref:Uncharacterized protein n=1 Tax=Pistacia integerrima TaxID=434235 RepID=A0ACC0YY88_9ROSI|nr:hypothetical protein Pint_18615 [Pistacia integerrima]